MTNGIIISGDKESVIENCTIIPNEIERRIEQILELTREKIKRHTNPLTVEITTLNAMLEYMLPDECDRKTMRDLVQSEQPEEK